MARTNKKIETEIEIVGWTEKGAGLGFYDNQPVEVPYTMPGDRAKVQLFGKKKGCYRSFLQEVTTEAKERVKARCKHFTECGGCKWQHLPYEQQLIQKEKLIKTLFDDLPQEAIAINSIMRCDPPWYYRNKMEFSFSNDLKGNQYLGLMLAAGRGKVLNLEECHLVNPWFVEAIEATKKWWKKSGLKAYHHYRDEGSLRTLTVREGKSTKDRMVILTLSGNPDYALTKEELNDFVETLRETLEKECRFTIFCRIQQIKKGEATKFYEWKLYGEEFLREQLTIDNKTLNFNISPTAFFQPNTQQAEKFYAKALELAEISEESIVFDLYCGTGTLGMAAAQKAKKVVGIELSKESSLDARENVKDNKIENMEVITGDVGKTLTELKSREDFSRPNLVIVDPPRAGLDDKAIKNLLELLPEKILYISCNPKTQQENLKQLLPHYKIEVVQPVDQFPHTLHMENIVLLSHVDKIR